MKQRMKGRSGIWLATVFAFCGVFTTCVSIQDRVLSQQDREQAAILGSVTVEFTSTIFFHVIPSDNLKIKAYAELKKAAQQRYPGNIDIKNISMAGSFSAWNLLWAMAYFASPVILDVQKITATGDVVSYSGGMGLTAVQANSRTRGATGGIEGAINRTCEILIMDLPRNAAVAVLNVASNSRDISTFTMDEIEFQMVDSKKFKMVDRKTLDSIRTEQNFQMSGEVSDASAVSIGNMLGAGIVITGSITGSGNTQRITMKALDVKTAQIIVMTRESF